MAGFTEKISLKEKAEEDMYFAALDRKLIKALHEKNNKTATVKQHQCEVPSPYIVAKKNND